MPRCSICDYSDDIHPHPMKKVRWNKKHQEFLCTTCRSSIRDVLFHHRIEDTTYLGVPELLEDYLMEVDQNTSGSYGGVPYSAEEEPDLSSDD